MFTNCDVIFPYIQIAQTYGFGNYMFQTNQGPSFPAHQFLFSGTSAPVYYDNDQPYQYWTWFGAENPYPTGSAAGCLTTNNVYVEELDPSGSENNTWYTPPQLSGAWAGLPCYNHDSMTDVFASVTPNISWKYYTQSAGSIWTGPVAIYNLCLPSGIGGPCTGPAFGGQHAPPNVITPSAQIFNDIASCRLSQVSWVTPDGNWSDHPGESQGVPYGWGASWVADIIDAIGQDKTCENKAGYWSDTAILVTWDDWGGWVDHVKPPLVNLGGLGYYNGMGQQYVYGFRVPLLVVSAYMAPSNTNHGYVSGLWNGQGSAPTTCPGPPYQYCHDFGSILNFIEYVFGTGGNPLEAIPQPRGAFGTYAYADALALDAPNAPDCGSTCPFGLSDFFIKFQRPFPPPQPFMSISRRYLRAASSTRSTALPVTSRKTRTVTQANRT